MPLLFHETKVFCEVRPCLMGARLCLVKISCFKPVLFFLQCELTCSLNMTKKIIELGFVVLMKFVSLDVRKQISLVSPNSELYSPLETQITEQRLDCQD